MSSRLEDVARELCRMDGVDPERRHSGEEAWLTYAPEAGRALIALNNIAERAALPADLFGDPA